MMLNQKIINKKLINFQTKNLYKVKKHPLKKRQWQKKKVFFFFNQTKRNVFCTLVDLNKNKVKKTKCSGWVESEGNKEAKNSYRRCQNMFQEILIWGLKNINFSKFSIVIKGITSSTQKKALLNSVSSHLRSLNLRANFFKFKTGLPHNGCRPAKGKRKKFRTKPRKNFFN